MAGRGPTCARAVKRRMKEAAAAELCLHRLAWMRGWHEAQADFLLGSCPICSPTALRCARSALRLLP